jgi:hypothetical protein
MNQQSPLWAAALRPPLGHTVQTSPTTACPVRQEGDEYACPCGLRWDVHEDRPPCPR